ncbi:MAG: putative bifunctional diguanylate cyclase/phosphodiesterase [Ilumatobacteraceae bacterium]
MTLPKWRLRGLGGRTHSRAELDAVRGPTLFVVVAAAAFVLGLAVVWRGDDPSTPVAGFWPAAGAAVVSMMMLSPRRWGWVAAGIVSPYVPTIATGWVDWEPATWWAVACVVEPMTAALVLQHIGPHHWRTPGRVTGWFLVAAVAVGPAVGGAIGATGTSLGFDRPWFAAWSEWALGDALGVLAIAPLFLAYARVGVGSRTRTEVVGLAILVATATALTFVDLGASGAALLPYVILIALIWAGMRFGTRAAAASGFAVGIGANIANAHAMGPFSGSDGRIDVITLQVFLAIALITSFVIAAMASELADRDEVQRLLARQATHDALTGLPNRLLFVERLARALQSRSRTARAVAVLLLDLDDFKGINDRHGHPVGDEALGGVAELLKRSVRPGDLVARLGGDEFVVVCEGLSSTQQARDVAAEVSRALDRTFDAGPRHFRLTASIGVAIAQPGESMTPTDLLRRADVALYHSKHHGGAMISMFDHALEARARRRSELHEELRFAIERDELRMEYQPIVRLSTGRVAEFEALLRWRSRRFGSVSPDEFIVVAEDTGLIGAIGDWVLRRSCRQAAAWRREHGDHPAATVAVNVSARQLADNQFPARVRQILDECALAPSALVLEITQTAVMVDFDTSLRVLADLRRIGVRLSMDDFGTGYSSLTYLRRIKVDTLKIDRSFVSGLGIVLEDEAIVQSIVNLAQTFGIEVVAEGIETVRQLEQLVRFGCDFGQGFLWSEAIDGRAAGALLQDVERTPSSDGLVDAQRLRLSTG